VRGIGLKQGMVDMTGRIHQGKPGVQVR
jgi:hypothetical protein